MYWLKGWGYEEEQERWLIKQHTIGKGFVKKWSKWNEIVLFYGVTRIVMEVLLES